MIIMLYFRYNFAWFIFGHWAESDESNTWTFNYSSDKIHSAFQLFYFHFKSFKIHSVPLFGN